MTGSASSNTLCPRSRTIDWTMIAITIIGFVFYDIIPSIDAKTRSGVGFVFLAKTGRELFQAPQASGWGTAVFYWAH